MSLWHNPVWIKVRACGFYLYSSQYELMCVCALQFVDFH